MADSICYRKIRIKDYKKIEQILMQTWDNKDYSRNKRVRLLMAKYDFMHYMEKSNYSLVASKRGNCVGVVLGRIESEFSLIKSLAFKFLKHFYAFPLCFSKDGRKFLKEQHQINKINRGLREDHHRNYGGELVLFVVNSHFKCNGIGSNLIDSFMNYLKDKDVNTFYLFTDEFCNVEYYYKRNYKELGKASITLEGEKERSTFYIFRYNFKENEKLDKIRNMKNNILYINNSRKSLSKEEVSKIKKYNKNFYSLS
jgi:hypothetical protein